jgi:protein CpxP
MAVIAMIAAGTPLAAQARRLPPSAAADTTDTVLVPARRRQLEQMVRARWLAVVRQRLQLTDAQLARLQETNRHFSNQRQQLNRAEHGVRAEMRGQLTGVATADDKRLAVLIDSLLDIQRQRLEIVQAEQRELAMFLTPLQRVRYLALQEQLRQRVEALHQRARARAGVDEEPGGY